jgi:hypothetical protein
MPFVIGDLLLKVDVREASGTNRTEHHVMLVLGETDKGKPIVAHMKAAPEWKLIKEELSRGKDLKLIHYSWSEKTKAAIAEIAEECVKSNKFIINADIIQTQNDSVNAFRPDSSLDAPLKLEKLQRLFIPLSAENVQFTSSPESRVTMSCHEWVVTVIHYACFQTKASIPFFLRFPPHLAWSDRLNYAAENDNECVTSFVSVRSLSECSKVEISIDRPSKTLGVNLKQPEGTALSLLGGIFTFFQPVTSFFSGEGDADDNLIAVPERIP